MPAPPRKTKFRVRTNPLVSTALTCMGHPSEGLFLHICVMPSCSTTDQEIEDIIKDVTLKMYGENIRALKGSNVYGFEPKEGAGDGDDKGKEWASYEYVLPAFDSDEKRMDMIRLLW